MRKAVTLIELIFVLIIIGVLIGIGFYAFKPKYLDNDANFIYAEILKAKYQGVNYDKRFAVNGIQADIGCIELSESALGSLAQKEHYTFKSRITVNDPSQSILLCFDSYGRPHLNDKNTSFSSILNNKKTLVTLQYNQKEANITIFPKTGYVVIKK
ncbi:prepilin-type N-terminal cleavage/methylation domain-containing protein [Nitratiruptor sp. SB155-2]|uniref:prepilin-type N-terminal cleavage/methylation domain-containing protein n=1 Tax=Nitratiruptor sp. (strain SB155-2) TaxID=387092 RepID=UPI0002ED2371|nr:prepilin-type N-terminal cleavage/methylation domain-containing protein [Nitratiruptor sp. SB155-2]